MNKLEIETEKRGIESKIKKKLLTSGIIKNNRHETSNALILHLEGDKKYAQKSQKYYNKLGLRAIVRNIPESRQPQVVRGISKKI